MNGWIFIDKEKEQSSFQVVKQLKSILNIKKIGHAGTLDPFATGVLAIALGEATKSLFYFNTSKTYSFNIFFGESKDTDDITGKTIKKSEILPSKKQIDECLKNFIGIHSQVPPRYSAIKINGQRAYKLARNKQTFKIKPRNVEVHKLKCLKSLNKNEFVFELECSSGTYVRSIARDLGEMLGTFAHVSKLRRTKIGKFSEKNIILLDKFRELVHIGKHFEVVHSIKEVLDDIPAVLIDDDLSRNFQNGLGFNYYTEKLDSNFLLVENSKKLLGIGKAQDGVIKPKRLFNL